MATSSSWVQVVSGGANQNAQAIEYHLRLYEATLTCDWKSLKSFLINNPDAIKTRFTHNSGTVLHLAVGTTKNELFLKNLLDFVVSSGNSDVFRMKTDSDDTALDYAARFGNREAANLLVEKDEQLLYICNNSGYLPLHHAASHGRRRVFVYLFERTRDASAFDDFKGYLITRTLVEVRFCDLALEVVKKHTHLATRPGSLDAIATSPSCFRSGKQYNIWERIIYSAIPSNPTIPAAKSSSKSNANLIISVWHKLFNLFWNLSAILVPRIKHLKAEKKLHNDSIDYVRFICKELQMIDPNISIPIFQNASILAATYGIHEIIEEIAIVCPTALFLGMYDQSKDIFRIAVRQRQHNVFNLIFQTSLQREMSLVQRAGNGESILHIAAYLPSPDRLKWVPGAALQMQRELQWFKVVEKFVPRVIKYNPGTMASTLFTQQHRELVKEGETWMRDTANSCIIAAALISTIAFAAAITVPGGNNGDTGFPIFSKEVVFTIFVISNAISLFSSVASLVMFLSMLTARYSEEDFLYSLPRRLIIGLVTLFISITSMMVTFGATIYLVFSLKKAWILILIAILACLPVSLFALLQFPLLIDIISSTYGPGIFRKQGNRLLF